MKCSYMYLPKLIFIWPFWRFSIFAFVTTFLWVVVFFCPLNWLWLFSEMKRNEMKRRQQQQQLPLRGWVWSPGHGLVVADVGVCWLGGRHKCRAVHCAFLRMHRTHVPGRREGEFSCWAMLRQTSTFIFYRWLSFSYIHFWTFWLLLQPQRLLWWQSRSSTMTERVKGMWRQTYLIFFTFRSMHR